MLTNRIYATDSLRWMKRQADNCVDLVFGSPPYEDYRMYGFGFKLRGEAWVKWFKPFVFESLRLSRGLVAFVIDGRTRRYQYSCTPELLIAELYGAGVSMRKSVIYERDGVPGSGGPDYFRNRYETVLVCQAELGRLPWSDNTACGHPPKYGVGGAMSNRKQNGERSKSIFKQPKIANPGNVVKCGAAGGGNIGNELAHKSEAPFPERLPEYFIRSFCKPRGIVLDPFVGSGTTCAVAKRYGRQYIGIELRETQAKIARERVKREHNQTKD